MTHRRRRCLTNTGDLDKFLDEHEDIFPISARRYLLNFPVQRMAFEIQPHMWVVIGVGDDDEKILFLGTDDEENAFCESYESSDDIWYMDEPFTLQNATLDGVITISYSPANAPEGATQYIAISDMTSVHKRSVLSSEG